MSLRWRVPFPINVEYDDVEALTLGRLKSVIAAMRCEDRMPS